MFHANVTMMNSDVTALLGMYIHENKFEVTKAKIETSLKLFADKTQTIGLAT
jgi:hypothetical protein